MSWNTRTGFESSTEDLKSVIQVQVLWSFELKDSIESIDIREPGITNDARDRSTSHRWKQNKAGFIRVLCPLRICTRYTKLLNHDYATYINDRWNLLLAQTLNVILPSSPKRAFKRGIGGLPNDCSCGTPSVVWTSLHRASMVPLIILKWLLMYQSIAAVPIPPLPGRPPGISMFWKQTGKYPAAWTNPLFKCPGGMTQKCFIFSSTFTKV